MTGLIGETDEDLVQRCGHVERIQRQACRVQAEQRFSPQVMTDGYEAVYLRLARPMSEGARQQAPGAHPIALRA